MIKLEMRLAYDKERVETLSMIMREMKPMVKREMRLGP